MHWMRGRDCRRQSGFTLAELAVTLGVLGLLLAIGVPSFARYQRSTTARNSFRQLVLDLRLARRRALSDHHPFVAVFDAGPPGRYAVFADANSDGVKDPAERWLLDRTLALTLSIDASALSPADTLTFGPAGRLPDGAGGGTVDLSGGMGGDVRTLRAWPSGSIETLLP